MLKDNTMAQKDKDASSCIKQSKHILHQSKFKIRN